MPEVTIPSTCYRLISGRNGRKMDCGLSWERGEKGLKHGKSGPKSHFQAIFGRFCPFFRHSLPCRPFPWFFCFYQGKPQNYQGFAVPAEPTKFLERTKKTPKNNQGKSSLQIYQGNQKSQGKEGPGRGNGDFWLRAPFSGVVGHGGLCFWLWNPLFPILGFFWPLHRADGFATQNWQNMHGFPGSPPTSPVRPKSIFWLISCWRPEISL